MKNIIRNMAVELEDVQTYLIEFYKMVQFAGMSDQKLPGMIDSIEFKLRVACDLMPELAQDLKRKHT